MRKLLFLFGHLFQPVIAYAAVTQHNAVFGNIVLFLALINFALFPLAVMAVATLKDSLGKQPSRIRTNIILFCESLTAIICAGAGWWVSAFGYLIGAFTTAVAFEAMKKHAKAP